MFKLLFQSGTSVMCDSYIIRSCGIEMGTLLSCAECHFTATRCLTTPFVVTAFWAKGSALISKCILVLFVTKYKLLYALLTVCVSFTHKKTLLDTYTVTQWSCERCERQWSTFGKVILPCGFGSSSLRKNNTKQVISFHQTLVWPQHELIFFWAVCAGKLQQWAVCRPKVPASPTAE